MGYAVLQALGAEQGGALLQRADTLQRISGLLESMRGAARGVLPHTQAAIFEQASKLAPVSAHAALPAL